MQASQHAVFRVAADNCGAGANLDAIYGEVSFRRDMDDPNELHSIRCCGLSSPNPPCESICTASGLPAMAQVWAACRRS